VHAYPFFISKTVGHHFWPTLMAGVEIEQGRKTKKKQLRTAPTQPPKEKTRAHHECMLSLPNGCMKFLFPKLVVTIFGLGQCLGQ